MNGAQTSPLSGASMPSAHPPLTEAYLLGELGQDERLAFEAHCLECESCGRDLMAASRFVGGVRAAAAQPAKAAQTAQAPAPVPIAHRVRAWWQDRRVAWAVAIPTAALGPIIAYQALVTVPHLEREVAVRDQPRTLATFLLRRPTRGVGRTIPLEDGQTSVVLALESPDAPPGATLAVELRTANGETTVIPAFSVSPPIAGNPLLVQLPTRSLRPGAYALFLLRREGQATRALELARFPFTLERK